MAAVSNEEGVSLNIMPMLDIFSILITFLLMSYSTDPVSYDVSAGVELPNSTTLAALDEIPTIIVTKSEVKIQDKVVATIVSGDTREQDNKQGAVYPVFKELERLAENNKKLLRRGASEADKAKISTLTMEMDEKHRFKLMKRIMLSAQQAEFITFKLMVTRTDG